MYFIREGAGGFAASKEAAARLTRHKLRHLTFTEALERAFEERLIAFEKAKAILNNAPFAPSRRKP